MVNEALYGSVEIRLLLPEQVDFFDRVHYGGVVFVIELLPDVGIGQVGQLLAEIHRDLARKGDVFRVVLTLDLTDLQAVVPSDEFDDVSSGDLVVLGQNVAQGVFGEVEGDRTTRELGEGYDPGKEAFELSDIRLDMLCDEQSHVIW